MSSRLLLLDTNLLILFVVGLTNRSYIAKHKRLQAYDVEDFKIVSGLIEDSLGLLFVPNVLTEASNLLRQIKDPIRSEIGKIFGDIVGRVNEQYLPSVDVVVTPNFARLGLTDAVLIKLAESGGDLLSDDLDLYLAAHALGLNAVNYNQIRDMRPDFK